MNRKLKEQHLLEMEMFWNIHFFFTVIFDQFNATLMGKKVYISIFLSYLP